MILSKAPLRVSFFGGGSDVPEHYMKYGGDVISTAIDKYVYVAISSTPHDHIKVSYSRQEIVNDINDIENELIRNTLKYFNVTSNIDIATFSDIPTVGTGLAGSSAFTCALVRALAKYKGFSFNEYDVADVAAYIEIDLCGWKIGKQDQYACSFGGMNHFHFYSEEHAGRVAVSKLDPNHIDTYMLLIPTNIERHAAKVLDNVDFDKKAQLICDLAELAAWHADDLPDHNTYGIALNKAWTLKKQMEHNISNPEIDTIYTKCMEHAIGCKLLGAGGGGYMLAITESIDRLKAEFADRTCLEVKVSYDGARVIYAD
jgi:D-glycero-alpha-D-manno-heptose-7-phosphate kinase